MCREHELAMTVYRAGNMIARFLTNELSRLDISYTQAIVLCKLAEMPFQTATQKQLQEYLQVTPASMSTLIKRMVKNGFLKLNPDKKDSRVNVISLTPKAAALVPQISACLDKAEVKICSGFSQREVDHFCTWISGIQENLKSCTEEDEEKVSKAF